MDHWTFSTHVTCGHHSTLVKLIRRSHYLRSLRSPSPVFCLPQEKSHGDSGDVLVRYKIVQNALQQVGDQEFREAVRVGTVQRGLYGDGLLPHSSETRT